MKKLMLAAAVAAAAFGLKAEIASANVVGYLDYNLVSGFNFFAPVFEKINSEESLKLSDITLSDAGDGESCIQIVTTAGGLGPKYYWVLSVTSGEATDGWFDMDAWAPVDFDLSDGQGFYMYAATATAKAKVNGQVRDDVYRVPLAAGFNCVGNSSPANTDIQGLKLSNAGDGESCIQVVNSAGGLGPKYYWVLSATSGEATDCWFDMDAWTPVADVEYDAGEGFYLYSATANAELLIPNPLAE